MSDRNIPNQPGSDIEILVVDDTPANLQVLTEVLSSNHYQVSAATSGKRALKQLQKQASDLILLDIQMPEMDGFELCQKIKRDPKMSHIPIIFITALSDTESIAKGFSLGAVDYITKPFREVELLARVRTHLNLHFLTEQLEERVKKRTAELQIAIERLQQSQLQMIQSEKMVSLGNLVAGVAHEINNPISFLNGSIAHGQDYVKDLLDYIALYQKHHPDAADPVQEKAQDIDLEFLSTDLPKLFDSMGQATQRINSISSSLRTFSRVETQCKVSANLHEGLDSTLLLLKYRLQANEHRPEIQVIKEYGDVPEINCFPGQLNQVFMNILANAIDAIDTNHEGKTFQEIDKQANQIRIYTEFSQDINNEIIVRITDNGTGIAEDIKSKIFEQGFTTKKIGKGTGLGMAIAHQIITENHGGTITCKSTQGKGTTFTITLPSA